VAAKILVVDDESEIRDVLTEVLEAAGFEVIAAADGAAALEQARASQSAVILLDLTMPRMGGMAALPEIKRFAPEIPVIICTAHTDIHTAVQAMRLGAYDYLTKPFDMDILMLAVKRALEREELRAHVAELKSQGEGASLVERMGSSPQIRAVIQQAAQVARSNYTVLMQGETGTGKELVARSIHAQSERREKPFVAVDCGAIPETLVESELFGYEKGAFTGAQRRKDGQFRLAHGGTLEKPFTPDGLARKVREVLSREPQPR
jgi:DNA-binding NtrC family response regulator